MKFRPSLEKEQPTWKEDMYIWVSSHNYQDLLIRMHLFIETLKGDEFRFGVLFRIVHKVCFLPMQIIRICEEAALLWVATSHLPLTMLVC